MIRLLAELWGCTYLHVKQPVRTFGALVLFRSPGLTRVIVAETSDSAKDYDGCYKSW